LLGNQDLMKISSYSLNLNVTLSSVNFSWTTHEINFLIQSCLIHSLKKKYSCLLVFSVDWGCRFLARIVIQDWIQNWVSMFLNYYTNRFLWTTFPCTHLVRNYLLPSLTKSISMNSWLLVDPMINLQLLLHPCYYFQNAVKGFLIL